MITRRPLDRVQPAKEPVHAGHAHVSDALHAIAHDLSGDRRLFGHRQIAGASADHGDGPGPFGQRLALDGHAARQLVINGALKMPAQAAA